ncbi:MAG: long-chain fatty acid--CoA ligase [Ignavibacteria bacterium]|nr:long-chain fatty acid--CoA ligase [Ignavibacteria bacterium]MBK6761045.1 long-chain fatty acid--CoA ligase [Ignavibacteria bacterium]MBK7186778.1 long-chain fatty acid--CoA ligase [Ignavibacteria bacterium]MBK7412214.1 long-chain fatty acid--CoA ligase [Ignavibacteria bacterium]MBK7577732.1 long-chain fatty acid--CoA ligase [Ignavibacteria bacterium]
MTATTIPEMFLSVCARYEGNPNKIAYTHRSEGAWHPLTHEEVRQQVELFADGLLRYGLAPGERVGVVSENRTEWVVVDFAMAGIGIVDVPIFPTLTAHQEQFIFNNCEATAIIVSNAAQLRKVLEVWDEMPTVRLIITMNEHLSDNPRIVSMQSVMERSRAESTPQERRTKFTTLASRVRSEDLLTLIYTSGTTGNPKGVMLTHRNLTANVDSALHTIDVTETDSFLSYLPMCHSYERMTGHYLAFAAGASVYIAESIESVAELMKEVKPTIMTSVPRLFERIRARVLGAVERDSPIKQKIFRWAMKVGERYDEGDRGVFTVLQRAIADKLVFSKIRERTGGRLRFFVSGGAALNHEVGRFFRIIGLTIVEGYGLTETSPVISAHRLGDVVLGTVGPPLPGVEVRIAEDGEILARGPSIMKGYWNDDAATRECIDADGWLHTGDIGEFTEKGHLRITDRKKHLLVSSGGKNIAPGPIEALIMQSPLIDQMMLVGDAREFCTALIVPDAEAVRTWAEKNTVKYESQETLWTSPELHRAMEADINKLQRELPKYERVRRFAVITKPFTVENGLLTPTLKVKRKAVLAAHAETIDHLYERPE